MLFQYSQLLMQVADDYLSSEEEECEQERRAILYQRENQINRIVLGKFMINTAKHLQRLADPLAQESTLEKKYHKKLEKSLKMAGITLHNFYKKENRNGFMEIGITVSSQKNDYYDVAEITDFLCQVFHKEMISVMENEQYIHQNPVSLCFQEQVKYVLYTGVAKATRENEAVSGDNYVMRHFSDGTFIAAIADGMGSGEEACQMSEKVLDLLERYIESEMSVSEFRDACNSFLYMRRDLEQSVTVDILECNEYTGEIGFYKNGSCISYLLQGDEIQRIPAAKCAFGMKLYAQKEKTIAYVQAGDQIIMMSDGVMDFYREREELLFQILRKSHLGPNELANDILRQAVIACGGKMPDDMTVVTIYVEENEFV